MEFDLTFGTNPLHAKDWTSGHFYILPAIVFSWSDGDNFRSTAISIKWIFLQVGVSFTVSE